MTFTFDPTQAARAAPIVQVAVGGRPLERGRAYRVATNEYIYGGGGAARRCPGARL